MAIDIATGQEVAWTSSSERAIKLERTNAAEDADHFEVHDMTAEMRAFDALPAGLKTWLDNGPKKYSALQIYDLWSRGIFIDTSR